MDKKAKMIKIGNTSFRNDIGSVMKYKQFKEVYSDKLKGIDIDAAWFELGGKLPGKLFNQDLGRWETKQGD